MEVVAGAARTATRTPGDRAGEGRPKRICEGRAWDWWGAAAAAAAAASSSSSARRDWRTLALTQVHH